MGRSRGGSGEQGGAGEAGGAAAEAGAEAPPALGRGAHRAG